MLDTDTRRRSHFYFSFARRYTQTITLIQNGPLSLRVSEANVLCSLFVADFSRYISEVSASEVAGWRVKGTQWDFFK